MNALSISAHYNDRFKRIIFNELLFWLHAAVILAGVLMGLILPPSVAVSLVVLHRIHLKIFDGCIISLWQKKSAGLKDEENYLQQMCERLFSVNLSGRGAKSLDWFIVFISILITALAAINATAIWSTAIIGICIFAIYTCFRILDSKNTNNVCAIDQCQAVTSSRFNSIGGIRLEVLGTLFFGLLAIAEIVGFLPEFSGIFALKHLLTLSGLALSAVLIWLQMAYIKNICKLCMNIHAANISIFVLSIMSALAAY